MESKRNNFRTSYNAREKIWSGLQRPINQTENSSAGEVMIEELLKNPEHITQICHPSGKKYTNRQIATMSMKMAQHFKTLNMKQCEVIGLCARNSDLVAPLFFGASLCGLAVSTLDPSFDKDGVKHIYAITKPKIMFCDGTEYITIREALDEIGLQTPIYTLTRHMKGVPEITEFLNDNHISNKFVPEPLQHGRDQTMIIVCSSGSTGLPKGVAISHANLLTKKGCLSLPEDTMLCFSTLYWISGLFALVDCTYTGATRVISATGFSASDFFEIVHRYGVSMVLAPPSQLAAIVSSTQLPQSDLSSIQAFLCGGSAVPYSLIEKFKPYIPHCEFIVGYGMSEVCGLATKGYPIQDGCVGQLAPNIQIVLVNEKAERVGPQESGEIWIKPDIKWPGYYNNLEATQSTYDSDGWIHSGDIGYMDRSGNLFVVDRIKDILKYNNFHFSPSEIENVINELPGVAEVAICGIPDLKSTFLPAAAVVKTVGSTLTEKDIYDHVAGRMAHFKHLRGGVYFVDELPKTVSGKNIRRRITELCVSLRNRNDNVSVINK